MIRPNRGQSGHDASRCYLWVDRDRVRRKFLKVFGSCWSWTAWRVVPTFVVLACVGPARAETIVEFVVGVVDAVIESRETAGLCAGVARGDEVLLVKGYGLADLENNVPLRAEAVCRIGSITKEFTAAAILPLAEERKLKFDDPLTKFLPDYNVQGHELSLRHLLNHTSGIVSLTDLPDYRARMDANGRG